MCLLACSVVHTDSDETADVSVVEVSAVDVSTVDVSGVASKVDEDAAKDVDESVVDSDAPTVATD